MRILIDTHIALWAIAQSDRLSDKARALLESGSNAIFYSIASVWEVAIKHAINPTNMPMPEERFVELCDATGFTQLSINAEHIFAIKSLRRPPEAPRHNDPFDRVLIAQAKTEGLTFLTHDSLLPHYGESCILHC